MMIWKGNRKHHNLLSYSTLEQTTLLGQWLNKV